MKLDELNQPKLLADQVYDVLHRAIISGELAAGSRLRIRELAAQVGTSVMPVREAIRRLEEGGFALREPHKGAVVRGVTLEELVHVYDVRMVLECEASRRGSERIGPDDCARMQGEFDRMRAAIAEGRLEDHLRHDEELLTILYEASGNPVLVSTIKNLWQQCRVYKTLGIKTTYEAAKSDWLWRYQSDLVEAARANESQAAVVATAASLQSAAREVGDRLEAERRDSEENADSV